MKQTIYLIAVCLMFPAFALAAGAGEPDAAGLQAIQGGSRSVTYKGRVVDERSSVPLAGVAIVVKDAPQIGMTTNSEGEFGSRFPSAINRSCRFPILATSPGSRCSWLRRTMKSA